MSAWSPEIFIECLGWTLLHFIWQGFAIAALLAGVWWRLRNATSNQRYLAACAAMFLLAVAPVITFQRIAGQYEAASIISTGMDRAASVNSNHEQADADSLPKRIFAMKPAIRELNFSQQLENYLPWLVIGWAVGVLTLSLRLCAGWLQIKRLQRRATTALDAIWQRKLKELGNRLGITRPVRLLQSALVEVPTVIGWLRPVILLPASCLVGLSPSQLEAILAHELAHIRRHDYLVNLLQNVVETLLFYHPAVWWVSRRVREERENCCDDLAVEICGDRVTYARALATLEELRHAPGQFALAAGGAPLLQRIRRLAGQNGRHANRPAWPLAGIFALVIVVALALGLRGNRVSAAQQNNAATNAASIPSITNQATTVISSNQNPPKAQAAAITPSHYPKTITGRKLIIAKLNDIVVDSVKFDNMPLPEVIKYLAQIAKSNDPEHIGINFLVEDVFVGVDIAAVTVKISPGLNHVRLADLLDAITRTANTPISYSVLDYGVAFSVRGPEVSGPQVSPLEFRVFRIDPNTFRQGLESVQGAPFGNTGSSSGQPPVILPQVNVTTGSPSGDARPAQVAVNGTNRIYVSGGPDKKAPEMLRKYFASIGVDLSTNNLGNAGKSFVYNENRGVLMVTATTNELNKIESGLQLFAPPKEVNIKVKFLEIDETKSHYSGVEWILKDYLSQAVTNAQPDVKQLSPRGTGASNNFPAPSNSISLQVCGTLTATQFKTMINELEQNNGVDELNAPEVTTESGRQAQIQVVNIQTILMGMEKKLDNNGKETNVYTTAEIPIGPVIDLMPKVSDDATTIEVKAIPSITEFLGYDAPPTKGTFPMPRFRLRQMVADLKVTDGDTIVLAGVGTQYTQKVEDNVPLLSKIPLVGRFFHRTSATNVRKNLLVFITPTIINPDGTRFHSSENTPAPAGPKK